MLQTIRAAGAERETLWVVLLSIAIIIIASIVIGLRQSDETVVEQASHQIDARTDLLPAEQGLFADLKIVAEEIPYFSEYDITTFQQEGLVPFVEDSSWRARGQHQWQFSDQQIGLAYHGVTQDPKVARSLLMVVGELPTEMDMLIMQQVQANGQQHSLDDGHNHGHEDDHDYGADAGTVPSQIWIAVNPPASTATTLPVPFTQEKLIADGWKQVTTTFDAGVTRE